MAALFAFAVDNGELAAGGPGQARTAEALPLPNDVRTDGLVPGRSTDVNEAVAVLSGFEYPPQLLQLNPGAVAFDLGANIGSFVLHLAALNRGVDFRGVAFEPYAPNFAMLQRNLSANDIGTFTTVEAAVTAGDGLVTLSEESEPDRVHVTEQGGGATVRSRRLSHYCAENGISSIDLLKLDVEGSEYDIIESDYDFSKAQSTTS